jgi:hypothetical protein
VCPNIRILPIITTDTIPIRHVSEYKVYFYEIYVYKGPRMMATRARSRPRHVIADTRRPTPRHADALPIGDARLQDPPLRRQVRVRAVRSSDALRDDARRREARSNPRRTRRLTRARTPARAIAGRRRRPRIALARSR